MALRDNGTLRFLLSDHLNGTNVTTTDAGAFYASLRYHPWGTVRYANGSTPTKYQFTGQYSFAGEFGLLDYKARYYDPALGRFAAADTVIPQGQGTQAWDRYAYANNSPTNFTDPSGHAIACGEGPDTGACGDETAEYRYWRERQYNLACQNGTGSNCPRYGEIALFSIAGLTGAAAAATILEMVAAPAAIYETATTAATIACADGDCLNEIRTIGEGTQRGITVLGRYPNYLNVARDVGGKVFSVPSDVWNKLDTAEQWALNQQFLDEAIARGDTFYLASRWANAPVGSFFHMELEYLFSKGYTLSVYQIT